MRGTGRQEGAEDALGRGGNRPAASAPGMRWGRGGNRPAASAPGMRWGRGAHRQSVHAIRRVAGAACGEKNTNRQFFTMRMIWYDRVFSLFNGAVFTWQKMTDLRQFQLCYNTCHGKRR